MIPSRKRERFGARIGTIGLMLNRPEDKYRASLYEVCIKMNLSPTHVREILKGAKTKFPYASWHEATKTLFNPAFYPNGYEEGAEPTVKK